MTDQRTYPDGVPCWVDTVQPDPEAACAFYAGLFGWEFHDAVPAEAPGSYLIARLDGQDVAAIAPGDDPAWSTYVAVDDADATAARVGTLGGAVTAAPEDAGPGGRAATCTDPQGAAFRLWQPRRRLGAQLVNAPGSWNFSALHTAEPDAAVDFFGALFGWEADRNPDSSALWRRPGYGDHLAATVDPDIRVRQEKAPPGFADAVAWMRPVGAGAPGWRVIFTVADRDDSVAAAERLGASVVGAPVDDEWTRTAVLRDPQGATFTVSQFTPTDW